MRLIDADKFKEDLLKLWDYSTVDGITSTTVLKQVISDLDNTPTIIKCSKTSDGLPLMDLRPRPRGEWKIGGKTTHYYYCSICGKDGDLQDNFCRNCGADMKGGAE